MRRLARCIAAVVIAGCFLLSAATPVSASPVRRGYSGETAQGERMKFKTAEYPNDEFA